MSHFNKVTITVQQGEYPIATPEEPGYVKLLAEEMDKALTAIRTANPRLLLNEALILLNLSYQDSYRKAKQDTDHMREQLAEYLEDGAKARVRLEEAQKEIARLEKLLEEQKGGNE